jgi:hypothetical protein
MRIPSFHLSCAGVAVVFVGLGACGWMANESGRPIVARSTTGGAPTAQELANTAYGGLEESAGPVTLADGRWEGLPYGKTSPPPGPWSRCDSRMDA